MKTQQDIIQSIEEKRQQYIDAALDIWDYAEPIFEEYNVNYAYLFGSYAKGKAKETSDIDILVSMPLNGLAFYELAERLRESLKKKIDLLDESQLENNTLLVKEILQDGIKIYG